MVGDKYTWLTRLARLSHLCLYSSPAVLREVGEVVYSQAENKTNISTKLYEKNIQGSCSNSLSNPNSTATTTPTENTQQQQHQQTHRFSVAPQIKYPMSVNLNKEKLHY